MAWTSFRSSALERLGFTSVRADTLTQFGAVRPSANKIAPTGLETVQIQRQVMFIYISELLKADVSINIKARYPSMGRSIESILP
jgi:cobalamin biosynthesis protein CobD/CbiB